MNLEIGSALMHPRHGAVTVSDLGHRQVNGAPVEVVTFTVNATNMQITIPVANVDAVGLRQPIDSARVDEVLDILAFSTEEFDGNWSRRYKAYEAKLASGDIRATAQVVHSLAVRRHDTRISAGEQRLLGRARALLVDELVQHPRFDDRTHAESCIDEALGRMFDRGAS
ncbi:CarD family transcriptional regulator [Actinoplanes sp. NPDC051851]|uniref:CarD family transcriptional regulator n=1 Tax=Actinoplanes sp. NPDC051851 TaxID=3154753 RepID=UPI003438EF23